MVGSIVMPDNRYIRMNVRMYGKVYNYAVSYFNLREHHAWSILKECHGVHHPVKKVLLCTTITMAITKDLKNKD